MHRRNRGANHLQKKIAILPLDTRPCCFDFTKRLGEIGIIEVLQPPKKILGGFTDFGDQKAMIEWICEIAKEADGIIISIDQLLYGGLVPSRTLERELDDCLKVVDILKEIKMINPNIKLYAANILMRLSITAKNKQYATYWEQIFDYSQLYDRVHRLNETQFREQLEQLEKQIPDAILADYLAARKRNHEINQLMIQLTAEGHIDYLVIPQEDTSAIGVHVLEQVNLVKLAFELKVQDKVLIYPGADEATQTLLARMTQDMVAKQIKIFPKYMSVGGRLQIAKFEDRPIEETVIAHITATGAVIVDTPDEADLILLVNTPIDQMFGGSEKANFSSRHLLQTMIQTLKHYLSLGKKVSIADVSFPNASDGELVQLLLQEDIYFQLQSYAGWNTAGNTLGTSLAHGIMNGVCNRFSSIKDNVHYLFLFERLLDEWAYQANVRAEVIKWIEDHLTVDHTNIEHQYHQVNEKVKERMQPYIDEIIFYFDRYMMKRYGEQHYLDVAVCELPWNRVFEIHIEVNWQHS